MKNAFQFKQFTVYQDLAAMKVGTDGVLLGAWANFDKAKNILDIGTGTGLIALMAAQRNSNAQISAIEIDEQAYEQAKYNFEISPWKNRLQAFHTSLQNYKTTQKYDVIISNPPYFDETVQAKDQARQMARNTQSLSLKELLFYSSKLLKNNGQLFLVLPKSKESQLIDLAKSKGLFINHIVDVQGTKDSPIKRILVELSRHQNDYIRSGLIVEISRHNYTQDYINLTKDFYLKM